MPILLNLKDSDVNFKKLKDRKKGIFIKAHKSKIN
jgi:hypothetical protein